MSAGAAVASRFDRKQFATWQARAAFVGVQMRRSFDDRGHEVVLVTKWAWTKELETAEQVLDFLAQVGAPA